MFNHRFDQSPSKSVVLNWFLLSFNGGCINAGGFLATGRFVTHVTGFATLFGVEAVNSNFDAALGILSVPVFFLLGSFISGLLVDCPKDLDQKPRFDLVMFLCAICLFFAAAGEWLHFGVFGENFKLKQNYLLLILLCLASGLQNAAITSSSVRSVRTTHLTGLTTDLGVGLARMLSISPNSKNYFDEKKTNFLRAGSIFSFILGSAVGALVFLLFGYKGFILSGLISCYAAWHGKKLKSKVQ